MGVELVRFPPEPFRPARRIALVVGEYVSAAACPRLPVRTVEVADCPIALSDHRLGERAIDVSADDRDRPTLPVDLGGADSGVRREVGSIGPTRSGRMICTLLALSSAMVGEVVAISSMTSVSVEPSCFARSHNVSGVATDTKGYRLINAADCFASASKSTSANWGFGWVPSPPATPARDGHRADRAGHQVLH